MEFVRCLVQTDNARLLAAVKRHPDRSDADIARLANRKYGDPRIDVTAARLFLGRIEFPEDWSHTDRIWLLHRLAGFMGFLAHPEYSLPGGRCDIVIGDFAGGPRFVVEVKSGCAKEAAIRQVARYQRDLPGPTIAVVTAPEFSRRAHIMAAEADVRLLTGSELTELLRTAAPIQDAA